MKLVIVESPNKCGKIKSFLGSEYSVMASVGHIREIPKDGMNIDIKGGTFEPTFVVSSGKKDVVKGLKEAAKKSDSIYLATDADREGESISQHIYDVLDKESQKKCKRITFIEITKKAILDAINKPRDIDKNWVDAQKARQVLDRLIGYKVSPWLIFQKRVKGSSAGRVQSVAMLIVCNRQREIDAFKPEDYWFLEALLKCKNGEFWGKVVTKDKDNKYTVEKIAQEDLDKLKKASYKIDKIEKSEKKNNAPPPFDTNSLQATCSSLFGWSLSKSQTIAQKLYETGRCFLPGTKIWMESGEILDAANVGSIKNDWSEKVLSVNESDLSSVSVRAIPVVLPYNGKINILKTSSNIIRVTEDHLFPIFDSLIGEIIEKKSKDIIAGSDYFIIKQDNKRIEMVGKRYSVIDILKLSTKKHDKFLFRFNVGFLKGINNIRKVLRVNYKMKEATYYKYLRTDTLPLSILEGLISDNIITLNNIEKEYKCVQFAAPGSKPAMIPFWINNDVFYLAGLAASDGHLCQSKLLLKSLLDKNPNGINIGKYVDIKKSINDFMNVFGMSSSEKLNYSNNILVEILNILGVPCGNKSSLIDINNIILTSGSNAVLSFIAGLWDGDGHFTFHKIKNKNVSIQAGYTSKSYNIINKLRVVLSQFGINTKIHIDKRSCCYQLKISIYDVHNFNKLISPFSKIKSKVYESIFMERNSNSNSQSPYNKPIIIPIELERQKEKITKENLMKLSGFDYWNYFSHNYLIPKEACENMADILSSKLIKKLSCVMYEKVIDNRQENYNGDVYCLQTENKHFLIENGIITHNCTYIRTDSFNISQEALDEVRKLIKESYDTEYLPKQAIIHIKKSGAAASASQEAHECIRPTHSSDDGHDIDDSDEQKMYKLIRDRFFACQMNPQIVDQVSYDIKTDTGHKLIAKGQSIRFDGWAKAYKYSKTKEEVLPECTEKESLALKEINKTKHTTKPPDRYNEGSLAKAMEKEGVGRPSTRAGIITSIQKKGFVEKDKKSKGLIATELGMHICDLLQPNFKDFFMDIKYTAGLENDLDDIKDGKKKYLEVVKGVYDLLQKHLKDLGETGNEIQKGVNMGAKCSVCKKGDIVEKKGRFGDFLSCSNYPECKTIFTKNEDGTFKVKEKAVVKSTGRKCPECKKNGRDGELVERTNKSNGNTFIACNAYPRCKYIDGQGDGEKGKKKDYKKFVKKDKKVEPEETTKTNETDEGSDDLDL